MNKAIYTNAMEASAYDLAYPEEPPEEYCDRCGEEMAWKIVDDEIRYNCEHCEEE